MTPFGHYLETLRRSRDLQQKQVAGLLDINPCYISALEKGHKGPPTQPILQKLILALELNEQEQDLLYMYVEQSYLTFRFPKQTARAEFALVHELKHSLGSLNEEQIAIITNALRVRKEESSRPGTVRGGVTAM